MSRNVNTSGDQIALGTSFPSVKAISWWMRPSWSDNDGSGPHCIWGGDIPSTSNYLYMMRRHQASDDYLFYGILGDAGSQNFLWDGRPPGQGLPPKFTSGKWAHVYWPIGGTKLYINGSNYENFGVDADPNSFDGTPLTFGYGRDEQASQPAFGNAHADLGELAMWNVRLTDSEIAALALGVSPREMRPDALVHYWPLWGFQTPEPNLVAGGSSGTLTGTTYADPPPTVPLLFPLWQAMPPDGFSTITLTPQNASAAATAPLGAAQQSSLTIIPGFADTAVTAQFGSLTLSSVALTPAIAAANATAILGAVLQNGITVTPDQAICSAAATFGSVAQSSITLGPNFAAAAATAPNPLTSQNSLVLAPPMAAAAAGALYAASTLGSITLTPAAAIALSSAPLGSSNQASLSITPLAAIVAAACAGPTVSAVNTTTPVWPGGVSFERAGFSSTKSRAYGAVAFERAGFSVTIRGPLA